MGCYDIATFYLFEKSFRLGIDNLIQRGYIIIVHRDRKKINTMKIIITFKDRQDSVMFMDSLNTSKLKEDLDFVYPSIRDLTLTGDFYVAFTVLSFWIENDDHIILRIPVELIKDLIIKETK